MTENATILEALLFTAGKPLKRGSIRRLLQISEKELAAALSELTASLIDHSVTILVHENIIQLVTKPDIADRLDVFKKEEQKAMSAAALETIAIVAYRGPLTRPSLEAIRGVDSRRMLGQLKALGFVSRDSDGRYDITPKLLRHLQLTHRSQLPDYEHLEQPPLNKTHNNRA